jgi:hypothetical protein
VSRSTAAARGAGDQQDAGPHLAIGRAFPPLFEPQRQRHIGLDGDMGGAGGAIRGGAPCAGAEAPAQRQGGKGAADLVPHPPEPGFGADMAGVAAAMGIAQRGAIRQGGETWPAGMEEAPGARHRLTPIEGDGVMGGGARKIIQPPAVGGGGIIGAGAGIGQDRGGAIP